MNQDQLPDLPPELKSLAADLAALAPASGALSRDELIYRAGWEACAALAADDPTRSDVKAQTKTGQKRGSSWLWPLSTAGLLLIAVILGVALATRSPEVRVVYIERPGRPTAVAHDSKQPADSPTNSPRDEVAASKDPQSASATMAHPVQVGAGHEYLSLRQRVLAFGVEVLESRGAGPSSNDDATIGDSRYGTLLGQLRGG